MKRILLVAVLLVALASVSQAFTATVFVKEDCGSCEDMLEYINSTRSNYKNMELVVIDAEKNFSYFNQTAHAYGFQPTNVPVLVAGMGYHISFGDREEAEERITAVLSKAASRKGPDVVVVPEPPETQLTDGPAAAVQSGSGGKVTLKLFWAVGCPHCAAEKEFLAGIAPKYPDLEIEMYEVAYNQSNVDLLIGLSESMGFEASQVPITLVEDCYLIGYDNEENEGAVIEDVIKAAFSGRPVVGKCSSEFIVDIPFFGRVDLREMGVPLSTVIIGLIDGFNPCAFFVLMMLLSFMMYARSRRKMLAIGLTFVFISGFVYFLFMTAMFSAIRMINEIRIVALVGGVIALIIGIVNMKDVFFFGKGFSLMIPEDKKPGLYKRMRGLLKAEDMAKLVVGTIVLAFVANSYELICTAGFPIVYGNLLNAQQLDMVTSLLCIALYNVFYVMPLLAIVLVSVKTLNVEKMTEERGELLKCISGFMMLGLGSLLIIDPRVLMNVFVAVAIILVSIILSLLISGFKKRALAEKKDRPAESEDTESEDKKSTKAKSQKGSGSRKKNKNVAAKRP